MWQACKQIWLSNNAYFSYQISDEVLLFTFDTILRRFLAYKSAYCFCVLQDYPSGLSISDFADDPCPVELEESPKRSHSNTIRNYAQVSDAGRGWSQRKNQMCTGNNLMFGGNSFSSIRPNPTLYRGNMPMLPIQNMGGSGMSERRTTYTCSYSPRIQNTVGPNSFYIPNQMPQSCGSTSPQIPMPFQVSLLIYFYLWSKGIHRIHKSDVVACCESLQS